MPEGHIDSLIYYAKDFINNLPYLWVNSEVHHKRKFQELIFPDGIYIENEKCRTDKMSTIFKVLSQKNERNSEVVSLGRFELPTPGLGNLCSIHLSYRDTEQIVTKQNEVVKIKIDH